MEAVRDKWAFKTTYAIYLVYCIPQERNLIKTPEATGEYVILSNKDFFLNCPSNNYAVEAMDTLNEQVLGALLRCNVKDIFRVKGRTT